MGSGSSTPSANVVPGAPRTSGANAGTLGANQRRNNAPPTIMRTNAAGIGPARAAPGAAAAALGQSTPTPAAGAAGLRGGKRRRNQRKTKRNKSKSKKNKKSNKN